MCLLIATTGASKPSKKALKRAAVANPDGFGFAVIGDNKIYTYRSMDIGKTISEYFTARDEFPNGDSIFHLRITTHGETNVENCHPFIVNDDVVMGHNGMLPIKEDNGRSDTRIFAEDWLPEFDLGDLLDTQKGFQELETFASGSKLAFLNTSSLLRQSLYIVNERLGHWNEGVWYSNNSYKKNYGYSFGTYKPGSTYTGRSYYSSTPKDYQYVAGGAHSCDTVWSDEEAKWVDINEADFEYDYVNWLCRVCQTQHMIDLTEPGMDFCPECGSCWYCEKSYAECGCTVYEDDKTEF